MPGVVEAYYTVKQLATLLQFSSQWIVKMVLAGEFGPKCIRIGAGKRADYRVPASGVNGWLARYQLPMEPRAIEPVCARSEGELKRKSKRFHDAT